jgi:hypothetical protein
VFVRRVVADRRGTQGICGEAGLMEVEYIMRCKLPSSGGFHSSPSGDTEYAEAYQQAVLANLPTGFEVAWKTKETWPKDKDGLTWVKLYCTNRDDAMNTWRQQAMDASKELVRLRGLARQIVGQSA